MKVKILRQVVAGKKDRKVNEVCELMNDEAKFLITRGMAKEVKESAQITAPVDSKDPNENE